MIPYKFLKININKTHTNIIIKCIKYFTYNIILILLYLKIYFVIYM